MFLTRRTRLIAISMIVPISDSLADRPIPLPSNAVAEGVFLEDCAELYRILQATIGMDMAWFLQMLARQG